MQPPTLIFYALLSAGLLFNMYFTTVYRVFAVCCVAVVYPAGEHVGTPLYDFLTVPITIGYQPTMGPIPEFTYPSMNYPLILSRGRQIFSVLI